VNDDNDLRRRFAALRRAEAPHAPDFERLLSRPVAPRPPRAAARAGLAALAAVLVAALGLTLYRSAPRPVVPPAAREPAPAAAPTPADLPSLARWRAPTDFLLATPGRELLYTLPRIGVATPAVTDSSRSPDPTAPASPSGQEHPS
jgi:hypothetical protein